MSSKEPWEELFTIAMGLTDQVTATVGEPFRWSFGGGTVLMLRLRHRRIKDIDLFIDDRQKLGMFNPRLSESLPFLGVHARAFLHQLDARQNILKAEFAAIDRLNFELSFDESADIARAILTPLAM